MHSDESWLSGLTRGMMQRGLSATESFFDLMPRHPHAIKTLFHILQMPFLKVFGYKLFAVRLLSLLFGCASLLFFHKLCKALLKDNLLAFAATIVLSVDIQFIYASHFARQEIIILFGILAAMLYLFSNIENWRIKRDIVTGTLIGLLVGVHPNSCLAALAVGSVYLYYILIEKKMNVKNIVVLVLVTAAFAGVFAMMSFVMDRSFVSHYYSYGSTLGVGQDIISKIKGIVPFYQKLYLQVSGTYYTPDIRFQLVLFAVSAVAAVVMAITKKCEPLKMLLPVLAVNAGIILIGRYSQPSVALLFPLCYLMVFILIKGTARKWPRLATSAVLCAVVLISGVSVVAQEANSEYDNYLENIKQSVPADAKTLCNLNAGYAFSEGALYDYRNLDYLYDKGLSFDEYIKGNDIEYIIYPEEMDYIHENRPVWNILYGNVYPYYQDMKNFMDDSCVLMHEFASPYAMRIVMVKGGSWRVKIYRVQEGTQ